jgi:catechol 2,3-dioxygenase-like lactoylglutathione lyase family enzyme
MPTTLARTHQLHGVQPVLPVPDVAAAADWFVRVLGFDIDFLMGTPPDYGRVKLGDRSWGDPIYIHLRAAEPGEPIAPCGETRLHVGHGIDALHTHVLAQGATVTEPPQDQPWGLREFVMQAPGGHTLVLGGETASAAAEHSAARAPRTVIVAWRAKPGQEAALLPLLREHVPLLQSLGLATDRAPMLMQAGGGVMLEAFEWASSAAIERAHHMPEVLAMWERFSTTCDVVRLQELPEATQMFAEFQAL